MIEDNNIYANISFFLDRGGDLVCVQILKTLMVLVEQTENSEQFCSLISHELFQKAICHPYHFENDEVVIFFIPFLKSIAIRLNQDSLKILFSKENNKFSLYSRAILFYNYKDSAVRISVFSIILKIFQLRDSDVVKFLISLPNVLFFYQTGLLSPKYLGATGHSYETIKRL
eukprot:TRINITY_DN6541_c0_g3_i1.p1 TRINITY_DN6541_c0_g3~~TRINITY_DN6541_c0_g3_i1.p1  ORF type:complete len:172 (+),score=13.79 TRINITY_DN6541_c0_g3_i1:2-517(+)